MIKRIIITGGGTGGHFFPALSTIQYFQKKSQLEILYIGDRSGIEYRYKEKLPQSFFLNLKKFRGQSLKGKINFLGNFLVNLFKLHRLLKNKEFFTLSFGGYVSLVPSFYSIIRNFELYIHEQNAIPGKTNLLLSRRAKKIFISFPEAEKYFKGEVILTGMPIREEIKKAKEKVLERQEKEFTLTIFGGSQGAKFLNFLGLEIAQKLPIHLILITGPKLYSLIKEEFTKKQKLIKAKVQLIPFSENIGEIYRKTDMAIARAGAGSCFELAYFGIPTIFIPYPYAVDDHQYKNALYFVKKGGAYVILQKDCKLNSLIEILKAHIKDEKLHREKSLLMEKAYIPKAEEKIFKEIFL
jgi:UDP-N-acetylglucosamine--N-acetylmuramyl-(pentapeptide) pyrophosphoryl-undecaprenol N-acetylglucosamine transferase